MNSILLGWMIISIIVIIIWLLLLLLRKFPIKLRGRIQPTKRKAKTGPLEYSTPSYHMDLSAMEYYGVYSPIKEGAPDKEVDALTEREKAAKLPRCPECGAAIGFADKLCSKCGLRLSL